VTRWRCWADQAVRAAIPHTDRRFFRPVTTAGAAQHKYPDTAVRINALTVPWQLRSAYPPLPIPLPRRRPRHPHPCLAATTPGAFEMQATSVRYIAWLSGVSQASDVGHRPAHRSRPSKIADIARPALLSAILSAAASHGSRSDHPPKMQLAPSCSRKLQRGTSRRSARQGI
jgi:hypothetical protein